MQFLSVQPGETVLEIGCGSGQALLHLGRSVGETGQVFGLDQSVGMLTLAGIRLERNDLSKKSELICGDAASIPYPARTIDAVFMCFTLELFDTPEIPEVLKECRRVLRASGRICLVAMSNKGRSNLMTRLYGWAHRTLPAYVDCRPIDTEKAVQSAGFTISESLVLPMWGLPVEIILARK